MQRFSASAAEMAGAPVVEGRERRVRSAVG
jgi:hypothetical protein